MRDVGTIQEEFIDTMLTISAELKNLNDVARKLDKVIGQDIRIIAEGG